MTAPAQDRPATTQAGAPPLPVTLRAIAAWLESHDAAEVHAVTSWRAEPQVIATGYLAGGDPDIVERANAIGDEREAVNRLGRLGVEWQIAPGIIYRLIDARDNA